MSTIELRTVQIGGETIDIAVTKRADGQSKPRVMVTGIQAADLIGLMGADSLYHSNGIDLSKRADCSAEVAQAVSNGIVELGLVPDVPYPLEEGVGVLLTIQSGQNEYSHQIAVLGKVSSKLNNGQ